MTRRPLAWLLMMALALLPGAWSAATADEEANTHAVTVYGDAAADAADAEARESGYVGWLELADELHEGPPRIAFGQAMPDEHSFVNVLDRLHFVADNDDYLGLVIYLDQPSLHFTQIDELADAIKEIRDSGKKVFIFSEHYDLPAYLLACAADKIILQRKGQIEMAGLGVEEMYLKGLLEKIGVQADMLQVGEFKGAADPLTRAEPSPEWSRNIDALLEDLYQQVLARIGAARGLTAAEVEQAFADCWTLTDEQYVQRKLVDDLADRDLMEVTGKAFGNAFVWDVEMGVASEMPAMDNPFAMMRMLFQPPELEATRPTIALVHAQGPITSGESSEGGPFGGTSIGSGTIVRALREAADDDMIKGAVVRIDSPGGSAVASEVIWQAIRDLSKHKPVFVSIGPMAASGGYYMACAGDRIYAEPNTIVGSIGVVGGKLVLGGLYEKVGLTVHRRSRGPVADMFNSVEPFTPEQRVMLESAFHRTYDLFVERVKTGRGDRLADADAVARGRLFTGRQAAANGLVDRLGGMDEAISDLAAQLGLQPGEYDILDLPPPRTLMEVLDELFMAGAPVSADDAAALAAVRQVLGPRSWRSVRDMMNGLMLLQREPVLTLMPAAIVVK